MWISATASETNTTSMDKLVSGCGTPVSDGYTHTHTHPVSYHLTGTSEEESRRREKIKLERRARLTCSSQRIKSSSIKGGNPMHLDCFGFFKHGDMCWVFVWFFFDTAISLNCMSEQSKQRWTLFPFTKT